MFADVERDVARTAAERPVAHGKQRLSLGRRWFELYLAFCD